MSPITASIQVLGSGCPTCKKLYALTVQACQELELPFQVEYVTDMQKIVALGVMQTPVLAVNGRAVMTGFTNDIVKIKEIIQKNIV